MSSAIQEIFLESEWQDEDEARAARDRRAKQLQAQGFVCICENLFTVAGQRVFLLTADRSEAISPVEAKLETTPQQHLTPRRKRSAPPQQRYEIRTISSMVGSFLGSSFRSTGKSRQAIDRGKPLANPLTFLNL